MFKFSGPVLVLIAAALVGSSPAEGQADQAAVHARLAQQYLANHEPAKAIPELKAVVALDPGNTDAHANLGVLLFFQGSYAEAVPQLKVAVDAKPELWKIRSLLGIAERRTGDQISGRNDLEAAFPHIDEEKLKIDVGRDLIESYAASEEFDKASDTIGALLKIEPTNPALLYISYRIHSQMTAAAMLELGLVAPDSAQTHQAMAHELQRDHDIAGTIANLRKALELDPTLPGAHFELAEALHASDDQRLRAQAETEYKLAVSSNPSDAGALSRLGDIEVEKGDLTAAATQYRAALQVQPGSSDAAVGLANVLVQQGKPKEALPLLLQVEAADPTNSLAHFRLSSLYRKLDQPEDVTRELALYQKYKEEREKLKAVYKQMRVLTPGDDAEKP